MIANRVKLVIWDLDDTFWRGALEEGGGEPIARNIEIVRTLSRRGIVNAICSKNDFETAKARLQELDVWDEFVFPRIAFAPKGQAIAEMIAATQLRAENVLFLDDNKSNLEEARYFSSALMTAHPDDVMDGLLDHPHLAGHSDPGRARLGQYRQLQRKREERGASVLSNEAFLRASDIRVEIRYDVDADFERIVELIERANQLNYTKRRLDSPERVAQLRGRLSAFSCHAGTVRVRDRYGDYGLVGFFLMRQRAAKRKLAYFVFSCRTMNMGLEQYVYDLLGQPEIEIVPPVAYGLSSHAKIDWIGDGPQGAPAVPSRPLLLLGGCDLLQLSAYCSRDRLEFVNTQQSGTMVRYDDPGFVLSDRDAIGRCETLRTIPCWKHADALDFDDGIATRDTIILSLWSSMNGSYFRTREGVLLRMNGPQHRFCLKNFSELVARNLKEVTLNDAARLSLISEALVAIAARSRGAVFLLGCNARSGKQLPRRRAYNDACRDWCARRGGRFHFVDVDRIVPPERVMGDSHFARAGYYAIARHILATS